MSKQTAKVRDVQQRIQELEREFRGIGLYEIACGQVFTFDKLNRVAPRPEPDSSSDMGKKKEVRAIEIVLDENGEGKEEQESTGPGADTLGEEGRIKGLADQSRAAMLERARSEESAGDSAAALAVYETCYSAHRDDASFRALIRLRTANEEVEEVRRLCEEKGDLVKSDETLSAWCHSANEIE
jgi:hypothetical protein